MDELTCDEVERLRLALSWMGCATPQGLEACCVRQTDLVRDLIRAVLGHKKGHLEAADAMERQRKDAERYRWLTTQMFRNETGHLDLGGEIACNWHDPNRAEIDHAVDAAMAQTHNA